MLKSIPVTVFGLICLLGKYTYLLYRRGRFHGLENLQPVIFFNFWLIKAKKVHMCLVILFLDTF